MVGIQPIGIVHASCDPKALNSMMDAYHLRIIPFDGFGVLIGQVSEKSHILPIHHYRINQEVFMLCGVLPFRYTVINSTMEEFAGKLTRHTPEIHQKLERALEYQEYTLILESKNDPEMPSSLADSGKPSTAYLRNKFRKHKRWISLDDYKTTLQGYLEDSNIRDHKSRIKDHRLHVYIKTRTDVVFDLKSLEGKVKENGFSCQNIGPTPLYFFNTLNLNL